MEIRPKKEACYYYSRSAAVTFLMSTDGEEADVVCCASCGKAGVDDVKKLKRCTACKLVRYCSVDCQRNHRPQHKKACKKRAAEIHDELLFKQPESTCFGDCPICLIPQPLDLTKFRMHTCCSKLICKGCSHANKKREKEQGLEPSCPFCRKPMAETDEENAQNRMKRVEKNDPVAITQVGSIHYHEGDYKSAFDYWIRSAQLGDIQAHYQLSGLYGEGQGVERDMTKQMHHLEEAACGGHIDARYNLGLVEGRNGRVERSVKHFIIAAKLGDDVSLEKVKDAFKRGLVSKEDYAAALRGHQAAVDATKSQHREEADEFYNRVFK